MNNDTPKETVIYHLAEILAEANAAYRAGAPVISDYAFDYIEAELKKLDPDNPYFEQVG